ncbi:hypothetical protein ACTFIW_007231 [Dictyostelium discoideum]
MSKQKQCVHIENCNINYESIDIQLYDNENITIPNCYKCSSQDNILICLECGIVVCMEHCKLHSNHSIFKVFHGDDKTLWCNDCNELIKESTMIEKCTKNSDLINKKLKDIENLFKVMKLFIYYDQRNLKYNKNFDSIDHSIKDIIKNSNIIKNEIEIENENDKIKEFIKLIKNDKCKNIIVLTGAGISVASGIPDFRSVETGLYNNENVSKFKLPFKEAVFDIDYFKFNPEPFYQLSKDLYPSGKFKCTPVHYFIKLLSDKGLLLRNYAQNADTLERIAGIPLDKLIEAHGSFAVSRCTNCGLEYSQEYIKDSIFNNDHDDPLKSVVPRCKVVECNNAVIKPDIVFFGESLPPIFNQNILDDINRCDCLIVIGTSLKVQPIASMVHFFPHFKNIPRLLINNQIVGENNFGGFNFNNNKNFDFKMIGDCQESVLNLSKLLNWDTELLNLINSKKP